jgi:hypothetical protein
MILTDIFAIALLLVALAGVVYGIRHMGSGYPARSVRCPHKNQRAIISTVCHTKLGWGTTIERDILQCSLLPGQPVSCDKSCLAQL